MSVIIVEIFLCLMTYFTAKTVSIKNTSNQTINTLNQMNEKVSERVNMLLGYMSNIEINADVKQIIQNSNESYVTDYMFLSKYFANIRFNNSKFIESIALVCGDGRVFSESPLKIVKNGDYKDCKWYESCVKANGMIIWWNIYNPEYFENNNNTAIGVMKRINGISSNQKAIIIFNLREGYFTNEIDNLNLGENVCIINEDERYIIKPENEDLCAAAIDKRKDDLSIIPFQKYIAFFSEIPANNWTICAVVSENELFRGDEILVIVVIALILSGIIISLVLLLYAFYDMAKPLNSISNVMKSIEMNEFYKRNTGKILKRNDEIGMLANSCNSMLDSLQRYMEKEKELSVMEAKAQLETLQQQINSHLLYNILNSISLKIMNGQKEESVDMVSRLAKYFRMSINHGSNITTVENEIEHIKNYVALEQYRSRKRIDCEFLVDSCLMKMQMPKLLLQPLVENSILHGFFDNDEVGIITISGQSLSEYAVFTVKDNGKGFRNDNLKEEIEKHLNDKNYKINYALRNIYIRMKLFYKDRSDMFLYDNNDGGACVELIIPLNGGDENANDGC